MQVRCADNRATWKHYIPDFQMSKEAAMQRTDRPKEAAAQQGDQDLGVAGCIPFQGLSASCAAHADHGPCRLAPAYAVKFSWYATNKLAS